VLLADCSYRGHRLHHIRILANAIVESGGHASCVLPAEAEQSEEWSVLGGGFDRRVEMMFCLSDRASSFADHATYVLHLARIFRTRFDRMFLPTADPAVYGLLRSPSAARLFRRSAPIDGLAMRGGFAYPSARRGLQRWIRRLPQLAYELAPFARLLHIDPIIAAWLNRFPLVRRRSVIVAPDPVMPPQPVTRGEARARLALPADRPLVVCVGDLDPRKAVDRLAAAFSMGHVRTSDATLVLAGRVKPTIRAAVAKLHDARPGRLILIDRFLTDADFTLYLQAADVVAATYLDHVGSSSLLLRAVACDRQVLASDAGWVGWVTRTFGLGTTCDPSDPAALGRAIDSALQRAPRSAGSAPNRRAGELLAFHTECNYARHWLFPLGLAPAAFSFSELLDRTEVQPLSGLEAIQRGGGDCAA
jgi:glycosyltransferase involved in cell wall biosynthesis